MGTFLRSIKQLDAIVKQENPDTIINFYDFLGGLYYVLKKPKATHIGIAHQFLFNHSEFKFPAGRIYDRRSILLGNKLAGYQAKKLLCLSFRQMKHQPARKVYIVPPLLREAVTSATPTPGEHFLVYMVNHGYSQQVEAFHEKHPEISIHCFWDKKEAPEELKIDETLTFHQLDDVKFIHYMKSSKGYLTTAGFESVCEAMYLGKPVLMVPVEGHYEQACNALDAKIAGAGIYSDRFDLELLLNYLPQHKNVGSTFQNWCNQSVERFLNELT